MDVMNELSNKLCVVCLRRGVKGKAGIFCQECRKFLCMECSDPHLRHRLLMNQALIDLDPPGEKQGSADITELASDFLERATVSGNTGRYCAQVAVESGSRVNEKVKVTQKGKVTSKQKDIDILKQRVTKYGEVIPKRREDMKSVRVTGVFPLGDKVIIVDNGNDKLKLFDHSGTYLSATVLKKSTWGITSDHDDRVATCGLGNKIFLWIVRGDTIISEDKTYDVDEDALGIHYNGTYYCVLHQPHAVTILDRQGRRVRKIKTDVPIGKIEYGWDIHMDSDTHNIYVPHWSPNGVLCMSLEGKTLWFTPLTRVALFGITEIRGALCIADGRRNKQCLRMISKKGQYMGRLLAKDELNGDPECIHYDEERKKLYVSYNDGMGRTISVFSIQ